MLGLQLIFIHISPLSQLLDQTGTWWFHHLPLLKSRCSWSYADSVERMMGKVLFLTPSSPSTTSWVGEQGIHRQPGFPAAYCDKSSNAPCDKLSNSPRVRINMRMACCSPSCLRQETMALIGGGNEFTQTEKWQIIN